MSQGNVKGLNQFATDLGAFLVELQALDASEGPLAGKHNFTGADRLLSKMKKLEVQSRIIGTLSMKIY